MNEYLKKTLKLKKEFEDLTSKYLEDGCNITLSYADSGLMPDIVIATHYFIIERLYKSIRSSVPKHIIESIEKTKNQYEKETGKSFDDFGKEDQNKNDQSL